jgi:hypothetical protein
MRKSKTQRRNDKKRERALRQAARRPDVRPVARPQAEWPAFLFDVQDGNQQFVEEVKKAVEAFRFEELPSGQQMAYRRMVTHGAEDVMFHIHKAMEYAQAQDPTNDDARLADIHWAITLGHHILTKIPLPIRQTLLPFSDVRFHLVNDFILVDCRSLIEVKTGQAPHYCSRLKPTVEFNGRNYVVAFAKHTIERIGDRLNPDWANYGALGDVFAYLEQCVYFEPCSMLNKDRQGNPHPGVSFFDYCHNPQFWMWQYTKRVFGLENIKANGGKTYYRIGYCPVFLDDTNGLARFGTLLLPGYRKTPEYGLLMQSALPQAEKDRLSAVATLDGHKGQLMETNDFSAIKWFHDNGIPQVIQTNRKIYEVLPKKEYKISFRIKK